MTKEENILLKHFNDLSKAAFNKGIPTYSNFLTIYEQSLLIDYAQERRNKDAGNMSYTLFGGYEYAERKIACFYDDGLLEEFSYPISVLAIEAINSKFSDDLIHRDYLGALMNLGIKRSVIGDIVKLSSHSAYVICKDSIVDFITDNLNSVKHTSVTCRAIPADELSAFSITPEFEEITGSVSSIRLDCILALAFNKSRTQISSLIKSGDVFINGRLIYDSSYQLKEGDTISARHFGKFIFDSTGGMSKKGKIYITLRKFT